MNTTLSEKIVVLSKGKSKSDLWSIVDSFPCLLELSIDLSITTSTSFGHKATQVKITNKSNGKSIYKSQSMLVSLLDKCEIQVG